ncbi:hypothetical protein NFI96_026674, partial [Prochilodus magdalenae]
MEFRPRAEIHPSQWSTTDCFRTGLQFLVTAGFILPFNHNTYKLPGGGDEYSFASTEPDYHPIRLYLAIGRIPISAETASAIEQLVEHADTTPNEKRMLESLLLNWPTVCTDKLGHTNVICHQILTTDEVPVRRKGYTIPIAKQQFLDKEIEAMLKEGIIEPSTSPWSAPVVLVPKKDGGTRLCIDYRALNAKTYLDGFPMPQVQEICESLYGANIFSSLDLKSGYWQVSMDSKSILKTAFVVRNNLYHFVRMPFGLKNAAATFQRLRNIVLKDVLGKFCFVYIDDIVVYSRTVEQHLRHLQHVFDLLGKAALG